MPHLADWICQVAELFVEGNTEKLLKLLTKCVLLSFFPLPPVLMPFERDFKP